MTDRAWRRDLLAPLHHRSIRGQLVLVLVTVPVVAAIVAEWVAPIAVREVMAGEGAALRATAVDAVRIALLVTLVAVACATAFASILLRASIRSAVQELHAATRSIARGDLAHRIGSARRDELGALSRSVDSMAERLQQLEHARRRVLACVSHELRTPLTIVQGHAFSLARGEGDPIRRERLELIQAEATRLATLVSELVDASSIHAGGLRVRPERVDLVDVVGEHVVRHADDAARRGVLVELGGREHSVRADVDVHRFGQVLDNLLANAVRHAPPSTVVGVRVDVARGGDRVVEVVNECEPIPADVVEAMFEPFVQGDARSGSVGLGLAIARGIVVAHGGSIGIDARAAIRGMARVSVRLPAPERAPRPRDLRGVEAAATTASVSLAGAES